MVCCFFGHSNTPDTIRHELKNEIVRILDSHEDVVFYMGNQGRFDGLVRSVMKELIEEGRKVNYAVVLAYMPEEKCEFDTPDRYSDTIYPTGLENVPQKFAISWRNNWMVNKSDKVVCYISHTYGGAYQFVEKARRKGKKIINLYNM